MNIDDDAPPTLVDVAPSLDEQEARGVQDATIGLENLEVSKVPLTIVTGKVSSQQGNVGRIG